MNKQLATFFVPFFLIVIGIYIMNDRMDVAGKDNQQFIYKLAKQQLQGQTLVSPKSFDQRSWIKGFFEKGNSCPNILIMGSSTVGALSQSMFSEKIFNIWLTGPTIEDYEAIYRILQRVSCKSTHIVLSIDPWFFNKNMVSERWKTLMGDYQEYHDGHLWTRWMMKLTKIWMRFKDDLSFETTKESFKLLMHDGSNQSEQPELVNESIIEVCKSDRISHMVSEGITDINLRESDGHFETCSQLVPSPEEIRQISQSYLSRNMHQMANWHEINQGAMDRLKVLISKFSTQGSNVLLIMPPYHPITYQQLQADGGIRINLKKMEGDLENMAKEYKVGFINLQDPAIAGCTADDFNDSHHGNNVCARLVSARILNHLKYTIIQ